MCHIVFFIILIEIPYSLEWLLHAYNIHICTYVMYTNIHTFLHTYICIYVRMLLQNKMFHNKIKTRSVSVLA